jgi:membrane protease YdiL (CAAX protease family)
MPEAGERCAACQRSVRAGTQFCPGCGLILVASAAVPERGARVESNSKFAEHWEELKRIGWLFGLLLATSFVFGIAARGVSSPWPEVAISVIDAVIVLVALGMRYEKLRFVFTLHPLGRRGTTAMLIAAVAFVGLGSLYFWVLQQLGVPVVSGTGSLTRSGWPLWAMILLVSVMPAVFEEIAFRGVIQSSLERILNARDAWLIQAALFSVMHLSPLMFPSHFLMGLCLGYMRRRSRSVYPGMALHALWNALILFQELAAH